MSVRVLYFAKAREAVGITEEEVQLQAPSTTIQLIEHLVQSHPKLESVLTSCVLALNQEYLAQGDSVVLKHGDEVRGCEHGLSLSIKHG